ncbi:MAG: hypothetical protein ACTSPB_07440 [Candidatus Thorarchaeota archaeon]
MEVFPPYKPTLISEGEAQAIRVRDNIYRYMNAVLPETLKWTIGLPVITLSYSKSSGQLPMKRNCKGEPIVIESELEITQWMKRTGKFSGCGAAVMNKGIYGMFFEHSPTGQNLKFGIVDLDVGEMVPLEDLFWNTREISNWLKQRYKVLPLFTGNGVQVWFKDAEPFPDYTYVKSIIVDELVPALNLSVARGRAHVEGRMTVDYAVNSKRKPLRLPLSIHYKTGRAMVPMDMWISAEQDEFGEWQFKPGEGRVEEFYLVYARPNLVLKYLAECLERINKFLR